MGDLSPIKYQNFIPPVVKFFQAVSGNYDADFERMISDQKIPETERVKNASVLGKAVGNVFGVSPEGLDVGTNKVVAGKFIKTVFGLPTEGLPPGADEDAFLALSSAPFFNEMLVYIPVKGGQFQALDKLRDELLTPQQKRVIQPVDDLIKKIKQGDIDYEEARNNISKMEDLSSLEKNSALSKLKAFNSGEREFKRYFNDKDINRGDIGYTSSWNHYRGLMSMSSQPNAGEKGAKYVTDKFIYPGAPDKVVDIVKRIALNFTPDKHKRSFSNAYDNLIKDRRRK